MRKILISLIAFSVIATVLTGCFFPLGDLDKLQSEIDKWLATGKRKTDEEIQMEVAKYMESNKFGV